MAAIVRAGLVLILLRPQCAIVIKEEFPRFPSPERRRRSAMWSYLPNGAELRLVQLRVPLEASGQCHLLAVVLADQQTTAR
jgi:hypothetical protein